MRCALVTGAAGFVGRHLMDALLARGIRVNAIDNFSCSSPRALDAYRGRIRFVRGDIRDAAAVSRAMRGADTVFHLAAIRSVARSVEDPVLAHSVNATGALILLEESARRRVRRFVVTSTSAVYGSAVARRQREDGRLEPISPYGAAKLVAEHYARCYLLQRGLAYTAVRIFNVYGPRQNPETKYSLVVPGVLSRILAGKAPVIDGTGRQTRDFVYIGDVVDALLRAAASPRAVGQVYNLGSGRATSVRDIVSGLLRITRSPLKPAYGPRRPGDPDRTCADVSKAARQLGWRPRTPLNEGLKKVVQWAKADKSVF
jgi:UDP-glucose 4-epimerase